MTQRSDTESATQETPLSTLAGRKAIAGQLARILASPLFFRAPAMRRLLQFLVENDLQDAPGELKETTIGAAVYGRSVTYDPSEDAVVRVNANRLRTRLEEYFQTESDAAVRIEIPRGSYSPIYRWSELELAEEDPAANESAPLLAALPAMGASLAGLPQTPPAMPRRRVAWAILSIPILVLVIATTLVITFAGRLRHPAKWEAGPWWSRLYLGREGRKTFASFSPDGVSLAYELSDSGIEDGVILENITSGTSAKVAGTGSLDSRPAWSPDGKKIAWVRVDSSDHKSVMVANIGSKPAARQVAGIDGGFPWLCEMPKLSWSHDSRSLYTSAATSQNGPCNLVEINVETGVTRPLTHGDSSSIGDLEATVSPDGRELAFLRNSSTLMGDLFLLSLATGNIRQVTHDRKDILGFCWDADGKGLILASRRIDGSGRLWHLTLATGDFDVIWSGTGTAGFPTLDAKNGRVAFTVYHNETSIWRVSEDGQQKLMDNGSFLNAPQTSPDGRHIAYTSDEAGPLDIWISNAEGGENHRLTNLRGSMANNPAWSPDNRIIAFECRDQESSDICLIGSDGSGMRHLTNWSSEQTLPFWSKDGRRVFFTSNHSGRSEIYSALIEDGRPQPVTSDGGLRAARLMQHPGLLVWRGLAEGGLACVGIPPAPAPTCKLGRLLHPDAGWDGRNWWDVSPAGVWWVKPQKEGFAIEQTNLNSGATRQMFQVQGSIRAGDRSFSIEPGGRSALYAKAELERADMVLLERGHAHL